MVSGQFGKSLACIIQKLTLPSEFVTNRERGHSCGRQGGKEGCPLIQCFFFGNGGPSSTQDFPPYFFGYFDWNFALCLFKDIQHTVELPRRLLPVARLFRHPK